MRTIGDYLLTSNTTWKVLRVVIAIICVVNFLFVLGAGITF